jgi:hypothetical protein
MGIHFIAEFPLSSQHHEASFEGESGLPWSFGVGPTLQKSEEQGAEDALFGVQLSVRHLTRFLGKI